MRYYFCALLAGLTAIFFGASSASVRGDIVEYYVGRDQRTHIIGGAYDGLVNPNLDRMTLLYAHTYPAPGPGIVNDWTVNHYHSKGTYSYTGPNLGVATAVNDFNGVFGSGNILPESPAVNDIFARPGTGVFTGLFRTGFDDGTDFNNLRVKSVNALNGFAPGTPENFLFTSSTATTGPGSGIARWAGLLDSSNVLLNLISISPGMEVRDTLGNILLDSPGDSYNLGPGNAIDFTPVFTTSGLGNYQAVFTLTNPGGTMNNGASWGPGGRFVFDITAVPEPSSLAMVGFSLGLLCVRRNRKNAIGIRL